jgi:hypothetical protein
MKICKLPSLNIPDSWESVESFCNWYIENNMPLRFPNIPEVFLSDDATAVCLFRHGQFQVELYDIHPNPLVQLHEHPGVEVIKVRFQDDNALVFSPLRNGQSHGAGFRLEGEKVGFPLMAVQHWVNGEKPTTVAAQWKGKTVGPLHEDLIRRFHPNALVIDGYADITRTMDYLKEVKNVANG